MSLFARSVKPSPTNYHKLSLQTVCWSVCFNMRMRIRRQDLIKICNRPKTRRYAFLEHNICTSK